MISRLYRKFKEADAISTDSRVASTLISQGQKILFFCLRGTNYDANNYVQELLDSGVFAVVTDKDIYSKDERCYVVTDTLKTLQELALHHREELALPIIAITGSNGKTTTKELLSSVLSTKYKITATVGNLNNHIGVPLTLLSIPSSCELAIVEMGANHKGEIAELCQIARPNYGIVTNIGDAHLEGFGGREGIIKGKGELYDFLKLTNGTVFYRSDDALLLDMVIKREGLSSEPYSSSILRDVTQEASKGVSFSYKGISTDTHLIGLYNIYNISAAIVIGESFKVDTQKMLEAIGSYKPQNMRSELRVTKRDNRVIVDAYNANPSSMYHALSNFNDIASNKRLYIVGQMNEMGVYSHSKHKEVVEQILSDIDTLPQSYVVFVGEAFRDVINTRTSNIFFAKDVESAQPIISNLQLSDYDIIVKGSRGIHLEQVLLLL